MSISNLTFPYAQQYVVSTDDIDAIKLRSKETAPLTHEDLDDNFANLTNKINEILGSAVLYSASGTVVIKGPTLGANEGDTTSLAQIQGARHKLLFSESRHEQSLSGNNWDGVTYKLQKKVDSTNMQSINFVHDSGAASTDNHIDLYVGGHTSVAPLLSTRFAGNGNVGIGTDDPNARLEVKASSDLHMRVGNIQQQTSPIIRLQGNNSPSTNYYADIQLDAGTGKLLLRHPGTNSLNIGTSPVVIDSDGNVGIGTDDPNDLLEIKKDGARISIDSDDYNLIKIGRKSSTLVDTAYLRLRHEGEDKIVFDSDGKSYFNGGNVGIGTTEPIYKLSVVGDLAVGDNTQTGGVIDGVVISSTSTSSYNNTITHTDLGLEFGNTATATRNFSFNNGNVGIGTTEPVEPLHIESGSDTLIKLVQKLGESGNDQSHLEFFSKEGEVETRMGGVGIKTHTTDPNQDEALYLEAYKSNNVIFRTSGSTRMLINNDGNVGIGTTSPDSLLHLKHNKGAAVDGFNSLKLESPDPTICLSDSTNSGDMSIMWQAASTSTGLPNQDGGLLFYRDGDTSDVDFMINTDGNVGIGTTTPDRLLEIHGTQHAGNLTALKLTNDMANDNGEGVSIEFGGHSDKIMGSIESRMRSTSSNSDLIFSTNDGTDNTFLIERMRILANGNVGIGIDNPAYDLDVAGDINFTGTLYQNGVAFSGGGGTSGFTSFAEKHSGAELFDYLHVRTDTIIFSSTSGLTSITKAEAHTETFTVPGYPAATDNNPDTKGVRYYIKLKHIDAENGVRFAINDSPEFPLYYLDADSGNSVMNDHSHAWSTFDITDYMQQSNTLYFWSPVGDSGNIIERYVFASSGIALSNEPVEQNQIFTQGLTSHGVGTFRVPTGGESLISWSVGENTGENQPVFALNTNEINDSDRVRINSDGDSWFRGGNVGIGTDTPNAKLSIETSQGHTVKNIAKFIGPDPTISFEDNTNNNTITNTNYMKIGWQAAAGISGGMRLFRTTADNPDLMIDLNGNVGIGLRKVTGIEMNDLNYRHPLTVMSGGNMGGVRLVGKPNNDNHIRYDYPSMTRAGSSGSSTPSDDVDHWVAGVDTNSSHENDFIFWNSDRNNIDLIIEHDTGNVGIGTTEPFADLESSGGLHIAGNTPRLRLQDDNPASDGVWDVMNNNSVFTIQHRNAEGTAVANSLQLNSNTNNARAFGYDIITTNNLDAKLDDLVDSRRAAHGDWYASYSNDEPNSLSFDPATHLSTLYASADDSTGAIYKAVKVEESVNKYRITVRAKASADKPSGFYVGVFSSTDNELSEGVVMKTHVSGSSIGANSFQSVSENEMPPQEIMFDQNGAVWLHNNVSISTEINTYTSTYTVPAGVKWFSVVILNWQNMGMEYLYFDPLIDIDPIHETSEEPELILAGTGASVYNTLDADKITNGVSNVSITGVIPAGTYIDISEYKSIKGTFIQNATQASSVGPRLVTTPGDSTSGVGTSNGHWIRQDISNNPYITTLDGAQIGAHSPNTNLFYYGANTTSTGPIEWCMEIDGLDKTNVALRGSQFGHKVIPESYWRANTTSGSSSWALYFTTEMTAYQLRGVKK